MKIQKSVQTIQIDADQTDRRIDNFLFSILPDVPKGRIYRLLRSGQVRVNSRRIKAAYRLQKGDKVRVPPVYSTPASVRKADSALLKMLSERILYEDSDVVIINKPAGLAVHGGSGLKVGLITALRQLRSDLPFLELAHRLDRETSGCLILAKSHTVLRQLHQLIKSGKVIKKYYALTKGHWTKKANRISIPIRKNVLKSGERMVQIDEKDGKEAITLFKILKSYENADLVEATLLTGRTHQIRVHAAHSGHPIALDKKYGNKTFNHEMKQKGLNRLFLHAFYVEFQLPNRKRIKVTAPPDEMLQKNLIGFPNF